MAPPALSERATTLCHRHGLRQYAQAYKLVLVGSVLFRGNEVPLFVLPLLWDLKAIDSFSWDSAVLSCLHLELCRAIPPSSNQIVGPLILLQVCLTHVGSSYTILLQIVIIIMRLLCFADLRMGGHTRGSA